MFKETAYLVRKTNTNQSGGWYCISPHRNGVWISFHPTNVNDSSAFWFAIGGKSCGILCGTTAVLIDRTNDGGFNVVVPPNSCWKVAEYSK